MVAGDVVNTAARMQAAAPVNGVLVGETTYRATRPRSSTTPREPVAAKGKAEPVPAWEALEARSRVDRRGGGPQRAARRPSARARRAASAPSNGRGRGASRSS